MKRRLRALVAALLLFAAPAMAAPLRVVGFPGR